MRYNSEWFIILHLSRQTNLLQSMLPWQQTVNTHLLAGRLTPAASVDVHARTHSVPSRYASSISFLSSIVSPLWWYATPNLIVRLRTGQMSPSPATCKACSSCSLSACFTSSWSLKHQTLTIIWLTQSCRFTWLRQSYDCKQLKL